MPGRAGRRPGAVWGAGLIHSRPTPLPPEVDRGGLPPLLPLRPDLHRFRMWVKPGDYREEWHDVRRFFAFYLLVFFPLVIATDFFTRWPF